MMRELFLSSVVFAGAGTGGVLRHLANRFIPLAGFGYGGPIAGTSLAWAVGAFA